MRSLTGQLSVCLSQYHAVWVLARLLVYSRPSPEELSALGMVPALVALLRSPEQRVQEQAACALSSIARGEGEHRAAVLQANPLPLLIELGSRAARHSPLRWVAAALQWHQQQQHIERQQRAMLGQEPHAQLSEQQQQELEQQKSVELAAKLQQLPQLCAMVLSDDEAAQVEAVSDIRQLLSIKLKPPIQQVVDSPGVVDHLVHFLKASQSPLLQVRQRCHTRVYADARGHSHVSAAVFCPLSSPLSLCSPSLAHLLRRRSSSPSARALSLSHACMQGSLLTRA